jgi:hypothetical protein
MIDGIASSQTTLPIPVSGPTLGASDVAFSTVMSGLVADTAVPAARKNTLASIGYVRSSSGYHSADGLSVLAGGFDGSQESIDYIADLQARLSSERALEDAQRAAWHQAFPNGTPQMQRMQAQAKVLSEERMAQWPAAGLENSFAMVGAEPVQTAAVSAKASVARATVTPTGNDFAGVQTHPPAPVSRASQVVSEAVVVAKRTDEASLQETKVTSGGKDINLVDQLLEQLFQSPKA